MKTLMCAAVGTSHEHELDAYTMWQICHNEDKWHSCMATTAPN
jgi:hypothetical protein